MLGLHCFSVAGISIYIVITTWDTSVFWTRIIRQEWWIRGQRATSTRGILSRWDELVGWQGDGRCLTSPSWHKDTVRPPHASFRPGWMYQRVIRCDPVWEIEIPTKYIYLLYSLSDQSNIFCYMFCYLHGFFHRTVVRRKKPYLGRWSISTHV